MVEQKLRIRNPTNTAWVPSPTAATLHALHYHQVDVFAIQDSLKAQRRNTVDEIQKSHYAKIQIVTRGDSIELDNNAQGILGYVVRRVDQGVDAQRSLILTTLVS